VLECLIFYFQRQFASVDLLSILRLTLKKRKISFSNNPTFCRDELVIKAGSEAGAMLVDGLGDGVFLEAADQDFDFLRSTSFGMLQGCRMRNTKTVSSSSHFLSEG